MDRTPRLWRGVREIRVDQPEPFFDPRLPDRAALSAASPPRPFGPCCVATGLHVREATAADGTRFLYGDRHQYTKMATLFTHAGLVLFLIAAAVTSRLGDEQGLVVPEGKARSRSSRSGRPASCWSRTSTSRRRASTPARPTDFTTDLAVYQDGQEIARKTIRVNDPLSVAGYTFHQNGFGPAPYLVVRDLPGSRCGMGPCP